MVNARFTATFLHVRTFIALAVLFASSFWCFVLRAEAMRTEPIHHRVHIEGHGPPTIIFEGGLGDTLEIWRYVQPLIAAHCARTVAYNRAGYPGSNPASGHRDASNVVAELRYELRRRGILPPYVLVGHSLGGLYMQYFARRYPREVAGLVLVDSTHWNQGLQIDPDAIGPYSKRRAVTLFMSLIERQELTDSGRAGQEVDASPAPGNLPTIVLSSTYSLRGETPTSRTEAARLQEEIAAAFPAARHVRVDGSGHYIQSDRPDVVIDSVRELAGCTPLIQHIAREHKKRPAVGG